MSGPAKGQGDLETVEQLGKQFGLSSVGVCNT